MRLSGRRYRDTPKLQSMTPAHDPHLQMTGISCGPARTFISHSLAPDISRGVVVDSRRISDRAGVENATPYSTNDESSISRRTKPVTKRVWNRGPYSSAVQREVICSSGFGASRAPRPTTRRLIRRPLGRNSSLKSTTTQKTCRRCLKV